MKKTKTISAPGPQRVAPIDDAVLLGNRVPLRITDTTLRDAPQSLWATRIRTKDILEIIDVIDAANSLDKLRAIGFTLDEIFEMVGYPALNTEFSTTRALTKNYATEGMEEGAQPTGGADDPAEESVRNRNSRPSKHKERRKRREKRA